MQAPHVEALYRQHADELRQYIARQLGCRQLAEDLCQDVFVRLQSQQDLIAIHEPRAWLYRVARHLVIDHYRREGARPACIGLDDPSLCLACPRATPELVSDARQSLERIRALLAQLPEHLRNALLWHRIDGLAQHVIGQRLGVSESMAGRYIRQAEESLLARHAIAGANG